MTITMINIRKSNSKSRWGFIRRFNKFRCKTPRVNKSVNIKVKNIDSNIDKKSEKNISNNNEEKDKELYCP